VERIVLTALIENTSTVLIGHMLAAFVRHMSISHSHRAHTHTYYSTQCGFNRVCFHRAAFVYTHSSCGALFYIELIEPSQVGLIVHTLVEHSYTALIEHAFTVQSHH